MALLLLGFLAIAVVNVGLLHLIGILALPGAVLLSTAWAVAVRAALHPAPTTRMPQRDGQPMQLGEGEAQSGSSAEWPHRRARLLVQLGLLTALLGVGLVVYLVFGPTYGYCEAIMEVTVDATSATREGTGSCGYRSMLEVQGVPSVVWAAGVAYLLVGLGTAPQRVSGRDRGAVTLGRASGTPRDRVRLRLIPVWREVDKTARRTAVDAAHDEAPDRSPGPCLSCAAKG